MDHTMQHSAKLPRQQEAIRAKCFHPTGSSVEFSKEEIEQPIPRRFERIAAEFEDRIAVRTKSKTFTYDALNRVANRVAHALLGIQGARKEPVAMVMGSDSDMIAASIGVLKAGQICVPINPSHPRARIAYILDNSESRLILTNNENLRLSETLAQSGARVLSIDSLGSGPSLENPALLVSADTIAFILYTSGSTGEPKGVVVNHRSLLHHIRTIGSDFRICPDDRLGFVASARRDVFRALLNGAGVYPVELKKEGMAGLAPWLIENAITILHAVPTPFRHFVDGLTGTEEFPALRLIWLLGEPLYPRDVELYRKHFPSGCILVNALGCAETRNYARYFLDRDTPITDHIAPVGYAVEDYEVLLFNGKGTQLGFDEVGEIAVKSRYLSSGYWKRPDLTNAAFQPDPQEEGKRLYFTGDLGLRRADGCLIYVGRKDFQLKIRGHRVEIAEVESALLDHDGIKEVAVVASDDEGRDIRLVAHFVPDRLPAPTVSSLRKFLQEKLPDYMIPAAFVALRSLPLTPNGKVHRKALHHLRTARPNLETAFVPSRTPVEKELAHVWAEVLSLDRVGIHDNFFDLGGHSLAAMRVVSQVVRRFQLAIPLESLFQSPTVAEMSLVIDQHRDKKLGGPDLEKILAELESLSEEDAQRFFASESGLKEDRN